MMRLKQKAEMAEVVEEVRYSAGELQFKNEFPELTPVPQCKLTTNKNDIMNFTGLYTPDKDSLWYGGKYEFSFTVPESYPFNPPKVMCNTKIYHPNIDFQGNVCLNILKEDWKPTLNCSTVIAGIYYLFTDPNPNDPLNHEAANVMRDNPDQFIANVKKTLKGGTHFSQEFPKF
jgi:ubiquitin-conjugating enzyme E2 M